MFHLSVLVLTLTFILDTNWDTFTVCRPLSSSQVWTHPDTFVIREKGLGSEVRNAAHHLCWFSAQDHPTNQINSTLNLLQHSVVSSAVIPNQIQVLWLLCNVKATIETENETIVAMRSYHTPTRPDTAQQSPAESSLKPGSSASPRDLKLNFLWLPSDSNSHLQV